MAFRLAVIPAGSARSARRANRLVTAMRTAPRGRTPAAVVEALGALESSGAGEFTVWRRTDARGALMSVRYPEIGVLEALLLVAKDHDLAVYDIDLNRLYDPTGAVDVEVSLPGVRIPFLTRDLLSDLVLRPDWPDPEAPFVIVDRAAEDFIQVWREGSGYRVEYRDGDADFHYMCMVDDPAVVIDVMWAWAIGDDRWRGALAWEFLDLDETRSLSLEDLDASVDADGTLRVYRQELGPAAASFGGEHEFWYSVLSEDVARLVVALGGEPGGDILDLICEKYSVAGGYAFARDLDKAGVSYALACWP